MGEPLQRGHRCTARAKWRFRRCCRRCASASCSCRFSCCKAPRSICSRRCRCRCASRCSPASRCPSRMVPVLFNYLMRGVGAAHHRADAVPATTASTRASRNPFVPHSAWLRARLRALPRSLSQRAGVGACPQPTLTVGVLRRADRRLAAALSAAGARFLSRRSMPGRCACMCARRRARGSSRRRQYFAAVEARDPRARRRRSDRRHAGQYRPALQRHQYRAERFGDRRARWTARS